MRSFAQDYIAHEPIALELIGADFSERAERKRKSEATRARPLSDAVRNSLLAQNPGAHGTALEEKLSQDAVQFVCTGQQVGLFLGPLYTIYKALDAIAAATALEADTGRPTIPLFWLQTEDHDFDEIRSVQLLQADEQSRSLMLPARIESRDRISVNEHVLGEDILPLTQTVRELYGDLPFAERFLSTVCENYVPDARVADAFQKTLQSILGESRLLCFNPRHVSAQPLLTPLFRHAFSNWKRCNEKLLAQGKRLQDASYDTQVHVREDAPLFFIHDKELGNRYRIERSSDNQWDLIGDDEKRTIGTEEIERIINEEPERISSSALLRPLIQDSLFPNAASILGDAEINYVAQLVGLYDVFDLEQPTIVPRPHCTILEQKIARLMEKCDISLEDTFLTKEELIHKASNSPSSSFVAPDALFEGAENSLKEIMDTVAEHLERADKTLGKSTRKAEQKMLHQLQALHDRYERAVASNDTLLEERLNRILSYIQPGERPQERAMNPLYFLCRYGDSFLDELEKHIRPFETNPVSIVI